MSWRRRRWEPWLDLVGKGASTGGSVDVDFEDDALYIDATRHRDIGFTFVPTSLHVLDFLNEPRTTFRQAQELRSIVRRGRQVMKYFTPLFPFLLAWIILLSTAKLSELSLINGIVQLLLFALVVCLPIWKTGRMCYVDIGWPWGLVALGTLTYLFSDGYGPRVALVSAVYIFIGLRMGMGALKMWRQGLLKKEFPRYQYQRLRWEKSGKTNVPLAMQIDALMQGLANASFLAFPAFIIASNPAPSISLFEILGLLTWVAAFTIESVADLQKLSFLRAMKKAGEKNRVCDVGLWRYSRHPNYFAEWMVWTGLVIAAFPSWMALYSQENIVIWLLLLVGLLFTSRIMYTTLVYATGAVPSEYFSVQKRPGYKDYQHNTNRFFPGPSKQSSP